MKKKNILFNIQGFSLIELMVVVAIIAILASFAIPQYQSFQSKARQKEGLSLLNSFYVATKATEAEQGATPGNFEAIGFNPAGQVHYRIRSASSGARPSYWVGPYRVSCIGTNATCNAGFAAWNEVTAGSFRAINPTGCTAASNFNGVFNVCASAVIRSNGDADTWILNERKVLTNTNDGVN